MALPEDRLSNESARAIEAILMVAQEPVEPHLLAQLLEIAPARVEEICDGLQAEYTEQDRGFTLVKVAGGYRFQSHGDLAAYVERFALEGQSARLSSAALETLAIVAYKQPLSRAQVAAIRGVNVDGVMRTLQQRGYVEEIGRDSGPGQAALFGTSKEFLERMGLDRIEDLPAIADLFPSAEVMEALEQTLRASAPEEAPEALPLDAPADGATPDAPVDGAAAPDEAAPEANQPGESTELVVAQVPDAVDAEALEATEVEVPEADATEVETVEVEAVEVDAEVPEADATEAEAIASVDDAALLELSDDDFPEPELPSWAIDPAPATDEPAATVDGTDEGGVGPDIDGDGEPDLPVEP